MLKACHQTSFTEVVAVARYKSPAPRRQLAPANYGAAWAISGGGSSCPTCFRWEDAEQGWGAAGRTGGRAVVEPRFVDDESPRKHG